MKIHPANVAKLLSSLLVPTAPAFSISNDDCTSAIILPVGTSCSPTAASWTDATESQPAVACVGATSTSAHDAWFSFTATSAHTIVVVTSNPANDAVLEAFSGICGSLTSITCADATLLGGAESLLLNTDIGTSYFLRTYWWDYDTIPSALDFTVCVQEGAPSPVNDRCSDVTAQALSVGSPITFTGTTTGADTIGDYGSGSPLEGSNASVWHAFTLTECANVSVAYCGTSPAFEQVWGLLASTCPASTVRYADGINTLTCGDGNTTLTFDSLGAGTWYLPVLFDAEDANGDYTMEVGASSCVTGLAPEGVLAGWNIFMANGRLRILPGSGDPAVVVAVFSVDGRSLFAWAGPVVKGETVDLDLSTATDRALLLVRLTTAGGSLVRRAFR